MENTPQKAKKRHRPALIALVAVAALVCVGMGWWQLDRFESASGTAQNLGYALQWPVFGIAFVWAYRRFVMLEADPDAVEHERARSGPTEIPAGILPERPTAADPSIAAVADADDPAHADYNRYLAGIGDQPAPRPSEKDQE
ncbi:transcriptional regulator [Gordonia phosphorivorans]|uniref:Transcriptional regulator n=1 Tax=Gordonia phosphorivorans TaxID=1056982 RepID=A0ABV6HCI9_9ACTN